MESESDDGGNHRGESALAAGAAHDGGSAFLGMRLDSGVKGPHHAADTGRGFVATTWRVSTLKKWADEISPSKPSDARTTS
jgi:hypothetical protein